MNDKADRLKAALRENLKRRKAHARDRKAADTEPRPDVVNVKVRKGDTQKT